MTDRRILLVDDERAITSTLAPALRDLAQVDVVHTSADAMRALANHTYDAAVVDLVLGDGDDPAALHEALSARETPVLLVSGRDAAALESTARARGWTYAAKPLSLDVVRGVLAGFLGVEAPSRVDTTQRFQRPTQAPPAPEAKPVTPAAPSTTVAVIDRLGDIVGVIAVTFLCQAGKIDGGVAVIVIGAILGVSNGIRTIGARQVGAGTAAVALLALLANAPSADVHALPHDRPAPREMSRTTETA